MAGVFTTRAGPVEGALGGTNLSATVGDDPATVRAARSWAAALIGADGDAITFGYQTHGKTVATVVDASAAVGVAPSPLRGVDALVTDRPGLPVGILAADCVPTLLIARSVVGVVHSGWRGLLDGVVGAAASALTALGPEPSQVSAFVGPAAGVCCYEVSEEIAERFARRWPETVVHLYGQRQPHLDLRLGVVLALREEGVDDSYPLGACTVCDAGLWSHRRGDLGRQGLVAVVRS